MAEANALSSAKFSSGLYLKEFPAKIRVLTRDPMVYNDNFGNTKYVFAIYNIDDDKVQILDKGPGFAQRFQEIDGDSDFGGDIRKIDLKVTTNGKDGSKEVRYTITPIGSPGNLTAAQLAKIKEEGFDLAEKVQKNNPGALRLSEVNAGAKISAAVVNEPLEPTQTQPDVVIEDIGDAPFNLDDIPF